MSVVFFSKRGYCKFLKNSFKPTGSECLILQRLILGGLCLFYGLFWPIFVSAAFLELDCILPNVYVFTVECVLTLGTAVDKP